MEKISKKEYEVVLQRLRFTVDGASVNGELAVVRHSDVRIVIAYLDQESLLSGPADSLAADVTVFCCLLEAGSRPNDGFVAMAREHLREFGTPMDDSVPE